MKLVGLFLAMMVAVVSGETALDQFASGNLKFTARLYNEILKENPSKNFIFSPFSIEVILALTRAGAKGQTANEFTSALNLPSEAATEKALKQFIPQLKQSHDNLKLLSANRLFLGQSFKFLDAFQQLATGTFDAGLQNVDFSNAAAAAGLINQWVEQQTNNRIKNLIQPDSIDATTRLVLVNALYFSGKWQTPFFERTTQEPFFVTKSQTKLVDMMFVEDTFKYHDSPQLNAQFLELPYLGDNITMTIVLPKEKEGLSALESNNLEAVLAPQNLQYQRVAVKLPSFVVESDIKLKPILKKLGLTTAFSDAADLSGISKEQLKIDDVIQKAFINVTTGGTEAAAATAVFGILLSANIPTSPLIEFIADRPFVYYIKREDVLLFVGNFIYLN